MTVGEAAVASGDGEDVGRRSSQASPVAAANEVSLRGRLSSEPVVRELPSGAAIVTFRLVVPRAETVMTKGSRQKSDWVECAAWSSLARRRAGTWHLGDTVAITGALRRRHYGGDRAGSALEVEVLSARLVERAPAARSTPGRGRAAHGDDVRGSPDAGSQ